MDSLIQFFKNYKREIFEFGLGCTAVLIQKLYRRYLENQTYGATSGTISEFRAITNLNKTCRACIYLRQVCPRGEKECSFAILMWIVKFLDSAETSIDAAIYLVTYSEFRDAFIRAHDRGVCVRFITDYMMAYETGSAITQLRLAGIEVRHSVADERHMMHRKSVIVDQKMVLMGTGNWTMQALCGNWDCFVKLNSQTVVDSYVKTFEREWKLLEHCPLQPLD